MQQQHPVVPQSQSASSLLFSSRHAPRFSSGCPSLDALLTPPSSTTLGLAHGSVLELLGPPGIGKTRTALGFVLSARFEAVELGKEGDVLVVDAEGSLSPQLMYETASLFATHNSRSPSSPREVCEGIHYKRICDVSVLIAFFYTLPTWLSEHPSVNLIIIDSLSSHLRPTSLDISTKNMINQLIHATLTHITSFHSVSVIVTSQLSLKLFSPGGEPSTFTKDAKGLLIPQLGDAWIGGQSWRVVLYYDERGERLAHLLSAHVPSRKTASDFTMDALGPCDHPPDEI